jgi:uncharacterized protein (TIGR02246 family)
MLPLDDRFEIHELVARYNQALDSGDGEAYADTFVEDGVFQIAGQPEIRGRDRLMTMASRSGGRGSKHWVTNIVIDGDGDSATMTCYLAVLRNLQITHMGRYENTLAKVDGVWKFVRRHFIPD